MADPTPDERARIALTQHLGPVAPGYSSSMSTLVEPYHSQVVKQIQEAESSARSKALEEAAKKLDEAATLNASARRSILYSEAAEIVRALVKEDPRAL